MANDYALGLFNGDTGVVGAGPAGELRVVFTREGDRSASPRAGSATCRPCTP